MYFSTAPVFYLVFTLLIGGYVCFVSYILRVAIKRFAFYGISESDTVQFLKEQSHRNRLL